jgi:hypothetical protein
MMKVHPESVLFVTLDSCRFDTAARAGTLAMSQVGPLHQARAPSHFTYGSHSAMFVGFTPVATYEPIPILNPKRAKLFKLAGAGFAGKGGEGFELRGANIIEGFSNLGYTTIGSAAMAWFDPDTLTGVHLTHSFETFKFDGRLGASERQVTWIIEQLSVVNGPAFVFINIGETHVPYWHQGAEWSPDDNCCAPFQAEDRYDDCARRQLACLKHVNEVISPLLEMFMPATILICGDHGDAWGEDGVWEHGVPHEKVLAVPLIIRLRGEPI